MFLCKQMKRAKSLNLGGKNTVWSFPKNGGPAKSEEKPNGKIRTTQHWFGYGGKRTSRGTGKPE